MKPLHLKIAGLNSFREEQEVDFSDLGQTGVFGIFGPTGSGKSTVLDAVTLALYGKVERAKGGTQGIINQNEDRLYVHFSFQVGGKKYIAERTYKRGNDGSINQYSCRLREFDDLGNESVIAEKKREMDEKVQEVLGLTVDDFTRAVVLPQGKFQEFLTLQGADRRKMLQRIFALEKYGEQLVKKIRDKVNLSQHQLEVANQKKEVLGDASLAVIQKAQKALKEKEKRLLLVEGQVASLNRQWEEYKEIRQLTRELNDFTTNLSKLAIREPLIKEKEEKLELAHKAEYLRPYLKQVTSGELALENKGSELTKQQAELETIKNHCDHVQSEYQSWENKYSAEGKALENRLIKLEALVEDEEKRDEYLRKLGELRNSYRQIDEEVKVIKAEKIRLEALKQHKEAEKNDLEQKIKEKDEIIINGEEIEKQKEALQELLEAKKRFQEVEIELKELDKKAQKAKEQKTELLEQLLGCEKNLKYTKEQLPSLPEADLTLQEIYQKQTQLQSFVNAIDNITEGEENLLTKEKDVQENRLLLLEQEKLLKEQIQVLDNLTFTKKEIMEVIALLEEEERQLDKKSYAFSLRESLVQGEPCPVCGSLEHSVPASHELISGEVLKNISADLLVKKQKLMMLEEEQQKESKKQADIQAYANMLGVKDGELAIALESLRIKSDELRSKLPEEWRLLETKALASLIEMEVKRLQERQALLEDREKAKEKLTQEIQGHEAELNDLRQKLSGIEAEVRVVIAGQENMQAKLDNFQELLKLKEDHFKTLAGTKTGEEVDRLFAVLKSSRIEMQKLQQGKNSILKELELLTSSLGSEEKKDLVQEQKLKLLENDGKTYRHLVDELTLRINQVTGGEKVQEVKTKSEAELNKIITSLNNSKEVLERAKNTLEEKSKKVHFIFQEILNLKNDLVKYQEGLQEKMAECQFISLGQLADALCTEKEKQELAEEIKVHRDEKLLAQEQKNGLVKRLANRSLSEEEWTGFQEQKAQVEEEQKKEQEELFSLKHQLANLEEKHQHWGQLEKEVKVLTNLLDQLSRLDKLFKGNTFVEFIAEEQLMNVAIDASHRLGELTSYRYALEVDSEGGFIIRDDANGGLRRPVATLSGGETFLTSLALALALSSQIQLRGKYPLEFFFLDEGFGTLDNHLLETVMNSLERLHIEKMTIGIISHVPELKARIPRSLIVEPAEKGGRGTRLRLEVQ